MKKLFTLLTLLVAIVTGAWGETNTSLIDGITLPSIPTGTYEGGTTVSHNGTNNAVVVDGDGNAVMQAIAPSYGSPTAANFTWANAAEGSNDATWSTTGATWDAPENSLFAGSTAYTTPTNAHYVNFARRGNLRTNRTFAYRFTNCAGVSALVKSQGNTDAAAACLAVYEVGAQNALTSAGFASSKTNSVDVITVDGLSSSKTYVAYIYGMNGSNGELYEVAFIASTTDPTITCSPKSVTLAATESGVAVNSSFTITGSNLTAGTYNLTIPSVTGLEVYPTSFTVDANGTVSQKVNLSYSSTENVPANTANITATVNELNLSVAVNYSASVTSWTLQTINTAKTWDFSTLSGGLECSDVNVEHVYANIAEITCPAGFDGTALAFTGQFPLRSGKGIAQNGTLKFKTSVPGYIVVKFSDTGTGASATAVKRYLVVNGETTEYWASREKTGEGAYDAKLNVTTNAIAVPAGEVTIGGTSALVYAKVEFTPTAEPAEPTTGEDVTYLTTTDNMDGWRAFYDADNSYSVDENTKVYVVASTPEGTKVSLTSIDGIPAGVPVILHTSSTADSHKMTLTKETASPYSYTGENKLQYTTTAVSNVYRLGFNENDGVGFYPYSGTPASGAVILNVNTQVAKALMISFGDETALDNVSAEEKVGKGNGKRYNLAGQLVGEGYKGIVIENGKKFNQ